MLYPNTHKICIIRSPKYSDIMNYNLFMLAISILHNKNDCQNKRSPMIIPKTPNKINERLNVDCAEITIQKHKIFILMIQNNMCKFCQGYRSEVPFLLN